MKKLRRSLFVVALCVPFFASHAQRWRRWAQGTNSIEILDNVAARANQDVDIQDTALDDVTRSRWSYATQYRLTNTLDAIRQNIAPYLQRAVFIGLWLAVILLIYNGLLLATNALHSQGEVAQTQKRMINILIWVVVLTWFYIIVRLAVALINTFFIG